MTKIEYQQRGISDHSPLTLKIKLHVRYTHRAWALNPAWLEIMGGTEDISGKIEEFIENNQGTASEGVVWDSLKAFLRGVLIQQVAWAKKQSKANSEQIRDEASNLERQYIKDPTRRTRRYG